MTAETPLADILPEATPEQLAALKDAEVTADKIAEWAMKKGGREGTSEIGEALDLEAFALDCAPAEVETAKKNFKVTITIDAEGIHVEIPSATYNIVPKIKGSATVDGEYTLLEPEDKTARFFKAVIDL